MVQFHVNDAFIAVCQEVYLRIGKRQNLTNSELLVYLLKTTDNLNALKLLENIKKREWHKLPPAMFRL